MKKEIDLFAHTQYTEPEPNDTDKVHEDYKGVPMLDGIKFKEPVVGDTFGIENATTILKIEDNGGRGKTLTMSPIMPSEFKEIKLVVLGEPKAQKRHRHVNMGKFTRQYDPSANDKGDFLSVVQKQAPEKPFDVPVRLYINFYFTRPKSHYKAGKNAHILKDNIPYWHTSKPDTDNCFKFVTDALNKVFWRDDSLICDVTVQKQYSEQPRIEITIQPL